jgi:hypothetical protein
MTMQELLPTAKLDQSRITVALKYLNHYRKTAVAKKQNTQHTLRETFNFGYDYFSMADGDHTKTAIPDYLKELCQYCIDAFGEQHQLDDHQKYENVIVSIYHAGYCLEPHMDVDISDNITDGKEVDFYFGENVLGVILQPDIEGKFFITETNNMSELNHLNEEVGTVYLLNGKYRRQPYFHGVSKVKDLRISVTFRSVIFNKL